MKRYKKTLLLLLNSGEVVKSNGIAHALLNPISCLPVSLFIVVNGTVRSMSTANGDLKPIQLSQTLPVCPMVSLKMI